MIGCYICLAARAKWWLCLLNISGLPPEFQIFCASVSDKDVKPEVVGIGFIADVVLSCDLTSLYHFIWKLFGAGALFIMYLVCA